MERISIEGDFFDCQLYGGRLYLWTFNGELQVYNYTAIIKEWIQIKGNNRYNCEAYENGMSRIYLNSDELRRFLLYERDYLTDEFPTGTEILAGDIYETNAKGLFMCKIPLFREMIPAEKLCDIPLVYVNGAQRRGLVCSGGSDGMFWRPTSMKGNGLVQVSTQQTVSASFCGPGIYAHSSISDSYLLVSDMGFFDRIVGERELFQEAEQRDHSMKLTWSWDNTFYVAGDHKLRIYEFVDAKRPLALKDEIRFYYWKGDFVSAGSSFFGTVVELDNAICLFEDLRRQNACCTITGPVTRWRMYPRSKEFPSHVHIIYDDRMDIVVMNDDIMRWYNMKLHRYGRL